MRNNKAAGFTVPELIATIVVFSIVASSAYLLLMAYVGMLTNVQNKTSALSIATEQMEYLRSLPYDSLAVQGGSIVTGATPIPVTKDVYRANKEFRILTDIRYADDAFDGCLDYGVNQALNCRNWKPGTPLADSNPRDYKIADVKIVDKLTGRQYSSLSSQFTSRVAETGGNASAIFTTILDSTGTPVAGAEVRVRNTTTTPNIDQTAITDSNGSALFLDVVPDTGADYVISVTKGGYSSLSTIAASGSLTPTYPNVTAIIQKVSNVTLKIDQISSQSLLALVTDGSGTPLPGMSFNIRGGIKLYTSPADMSYSYQQTVTTNASGEVQLGSLVPGVYSVCYSTQPRPCSSTNSYRLLSVRAAYGASSHQPFSITGGASSPVDGGPMQRIVLVVSTSSTAPRITSVAPTNFSRSATDAGVSEVQINGANLDGATVLLRRAGVTRSGVLIGTDTSTSIKREFNLSGSDEGPYELIVQRGGVEVIQNGVVPGLLGGINVTN